jgi:2-hydroxy-6-oxonona-2,4-dienedioate hydrolase
MLVHSRRVQTPCGDGTMVWRSWGEGKPVVLLHGGSGSWTHWIRNIPTLLACGRQVWVPDLPGFGDSASPPGGGDADVVIAPLALGLREVLGPEPHEIAAFSFGSLVAVLLATQQPALVSRMLLVGLPVLPLHYGRGVAMHPMGAAMTPEMRADTHRANLAKIMIHQASRIDDDTVALQAINVLKDRMRSRKLVTTDACANAVRALQCGFECVWGGEDVLYRDRWADVYAACEASASCTRVALIPDAGHWVQFEQAEAFNQVLAVWARRT